MTDRSPAHPARLPPSWIAASVAATAAVVVVAVARGPVAVPPAGVALELADRLPLVHLDSGLDDGQVGIVTAIRLPRVALTVLVGALLATSGAAYQGVFRNPLADPYLLGASAGAGLGVTLSITLTSGRLGGVVALTPAAAFVGALGAVGLAYRLGVAGDGGRSDGSLILAGVAVAALITAVQTFLLQRDEEAVREVYAWLLGRFNAATWRDVATIAPAALVCVVALIALAPHLDVLSVGDLEAASLGLRVERIRLLVVVVATLATATAVAVSGLIGFVGIVVPHAIRLRAGPGHRRILPLAALLGGAFLCAADLVARTVLAPAEVPIGVITALVGCPFFLVVLRASRPAAT